MGCYRPIPGAQPYAGAPVRLWPPLGQQTIAIPCGKCIGCKSANAAAWGKRCAHEMTRWEKSAFLTLTYDDDHLPVDGQLQQDDLQRFIKRLRKYAQRRNNKLEQGHSQAIRYFACGEYGSRTGRAHYHMLAFNCGFTDRAKCGQNGEHVLYESDTLSALWGHGLANYGEATPAAANYIAQYTLKKQTTRRHERYTDREGYVDTDTGEWYPKLRPAHNRPIQPFLAMSLKPPIGAEWVKQYADDMRKGFLTDNGHKYAIPRTYRDRLRKIGDQRLDEIELAIANNRKVETPEQLRNAEIIHTRLKQLTEKRKL